MVLELLEELPLLLFDMNMEGKLFKALVMRNDMVLCKGGVGGGGYAGGVWWKTKR